MSTVAVAQCREGFEIEAGLDLAALARACGVTADVQAVPRSGHAIATVGGASAPVLARWTSAERAAPPVFARSVFIGTGPLTIASPARGNDRPDRVEPLAQALAALIGKRAVQAPWVEYPDTNAGKELSSLARALEPRLAARLAALAVPVTDAAGAARAHVFLLDGSTAYIGCSAAGTGAAWPMGIPRLRMPAGAPSRSARKLAEAFVTFLGPRQADVLRPGQRAVDLGAAPGGWSWQLARHGLRVTAVDNGPLKGEAADDPLITHVREDGLHFRPRRPVDWLTCDMAEKPSRIAALVGTWLGEGIARHAIFNLKLPMKRRYEEMERCRSIILAALGERQVRGALALRQLYHDREEITGYATSEPHSAAR